MTSVPPTASSSNVLAATENLWERAAARLQEKDKLLILHNDTVSLKDILSTVEAEKKTSESSRLVVKRGPDKDPIILRDVFSKIAGWIEKFVAVGDVAVQYDPGHAALPWAAVRLVLQISVQDVRRYASVLEGIEKVSKIITSCTIMESIYFRKQIRATEQAKNALVDLYASILCFLAKARRYFTKPTLRRTLGSMIDFDNKFQLILKNIGEEESKIQQYTVLMDAEYQKDIERNLEAMSLEQKHDDQRLRALLGDMQRPIDQIEKRLQSYEDGLQAAERVQILEWLSPIPYMQHHVQSQRDVLPGTGQWLLEDDRLLEWQLSESSSILWLHGIPGSGKSKLVSILVESLLKRFNAGNGSNPAFFYCTRNPAERERASPEAILRSLVRQMSCHNAGHAIEGLTKDVYSARKGNAFAAGPLSLEESISLIIQLTGLRSRTIIVIDALDECNRQEREHLLDGLSKIVKDSTSSVKIFASSREETEIFYHLDGCPNIQIAANQNQKDIESFVNKEVDDQIQKKRLLYGRVPETLRQRIKHVLYEQAQGMFRWVSMQLQYLCTIKVAGLVEQRLGKLPQNLRKIYEETYTERFREYQDEEKALVQCALQWLLCSHEPLNTETFLTLTSSSFYQKAVIELSRDALLDLCFNFIVHDAELDVFRFAHLSVREYLESVDVYQPETSHAVAAEYCLRLLTFELSLWPGPESHQEHGAEDESKRNSQIIQYTHDYWAHHLKKSGNLRFAEPLRTLFSKFTIDHQVISPDFSHWAETSQGPHRKKQHSLYGRDRDMISDPVDVIFTASAWDFEELMERRIIMNSKTLNTENESGRTALHVACNWASLKVARLLIEQGVDLEARDGVKNNGYTALIIAVSNRHTDLVQILLENDADPCKKVYNGLTALGLAIDRGSTAITNLLIRFGAKATGLGQNSDKFSDAVYWGHIGIVKALCEKTGVDEASQKRWLAIANLMRVIRDFGDVKMLFECDGRNDLTDRATLRAALFVSVECHNVDAGRTLIAECHNVDAGRTLEAKIADLCSFGTSPWWSADFRKNSILGTAIRQLPTDATSTREVAFIELLLDSGALFDLDPSTTTRWSTPLEDAVRSRNEAVVSMLLERKVRLDRENYEIRFPSGKSGTGSILDVAEEHGRTDISRLLKAHGCVSAISHISHDDSWSLDFLPLVD